MQNSLTYWKQQMVPIVTKSLLQKGVLQQLKLMGLEAHPEFVSADGMFSVDIMVNFHGCQVAVEVTGPMHYTSNQVAVTGMAAGTCVMQHQQQSGEMQYMLLGPDLLRFKLLAARGFAVVAVSVYEAQEALRVPSGAVALRQALRRKLEAAVTLHKQLSDSSRSSSSSGKGAGSSSSIDSRSSSGSTEVARARSDEAQPSVPPALTSTRTYVPPQGLTKPVLSAVKVRKGSNKERQEIRPGHQRLKRLQQRQQQRIEVQADAMQALLVAAVLPGPPGPHVATKSSTSCSSSADAGRDDDLAVAESLQETLESTLTLDDFDDDDEFDLPLDMDAVI